MVKRPTEVVTQLAMHEVMMHKKQSSTARFRFSHDGGHDLITCRKTKSLPVRWLLLWDMHVGGRKIGQTCSFRNEHMCVLPELRHSPNTRVMRFLEHSCMFRRKFFRRKLQFKRWGAAHPGCKHNAGILGFEEASYCAGGGRVLCFAVVTGGPLF